MHGAEIQCDSVAVNLIFAGSLQAVQAEPWRWGGCLLGRICLNGERLPHSREVKSSITGARIRCFGGLSGFMHAR